MTRSEWARRKGRSSSFIAKSTRLAIYARDKFDCVYCRQVFPPNMLGIGLTLDHVIPRSEGGTNRPDNLVTACTDCNCRKQARGLEALVDEREIKKVKARVSKALRRPLNRELGRFLCSLKGNEPNRPCYANTVLL